MENARTVVPFSPEQIKQRHANSGQDNMRRLQAKVEWLILKQMHAEHSN